MSEISAARHNNLQARISAILGTGSGEKGYGQTVSSYQVGGPSFDIIQAADLNFVYADMVKARIHQIGPSSLEIAQVVKDLNVIATETSYQTSDGVTELPDPNGEKKGIVDFERLMTDIEADKLLVDSSQADIENAITSSRNQSWNEEIYHEFVVEFNNADHRRHFFNSGGYISMSADIANTTTDKGLDWKELLEFVGNIIFDYQSTKNESDGTGTLIGNYELTNEYQVVYDKIGGGSYSSVYGGNNYRISAKEISSGTAIQFKVEFRDIIQDNTVDNVIDGTITSRVQQRRANSANVSVESPTYFNILELSSFETPPSFYTLSSDKSTVTEGESFDVTLETFNVANGSTVPYSITGVNSTDINGESVFGNFIVNKGSDTKQFTVSEDFDNEPSDVFTLSLNNGESSVSVNLNDKYGRSSGLFGKRYIGYFRDDIEFLEVAPLHGDTEVTEQINFSTGDQNYTWMWVGTFKPSASGEWTFYTNSDDASYLWIGTDAINNYTVDNALVKNGGVHAPNEESSTINLNENTYYPIRIITGNQSLTGDNNPGSMIVSFSGPNRIKTSNGEGYYFDGDWAWDEWNTNSQPDPSLDNAFYFSNPTLGTESALGVAAGAGLPVNYSSEDGEAIWPKNLTQSYHDYTPGFVGAEITPSTDTIIIRAACDNLFDAFVNRYNYIGSGSNYLTWYEYEVSVDPGIKNYISFKVKNTGGPFGFVAQIREPDGTLLTKTNKDTWYSS